MGSSGAPDEVFTCRYCKRKGVQFNSSLQYVRIKTASSCGLFTMSRGRRYRCDYLFKNKTEIPSTTCKYKFKCFAIITGKLQENIKKFTYSTGHDDQVIIFHDYHLVTKIPLVISYPRHQVS